MALHLPELVAAWAPELKPRALPLQVGLSLVVVPVVLQQVAPPVAPLWAVPLVVAAR